MSGLEELSDLTFVREALERRDRLEREAIERGRAERQARVAAIPGALEDFDLGESFRRAQVLLLERVQSYGDDLGADLLRTLAHFGRLHRTRGADRVFSAALDAYVIACRLAAFDPVTPVLSTRLGVEAWSLPELAEELSRLERRLLDAAEGQEEADARLNAIDYRKAAAQVAWARSSLGPPSV